MPDDYAIDIIYRVENSIFLPPNPEILTRFRTLYSSLIRISRTFSPLRLSRPLNNLSHLYRFIFLSISPPKAVFLR